MLRLVVGIALLVASRPVARWWFGRGGRAWRAVITGAGVRDLIVAGGQLGVLAGARPTWWRIARAMDVVDVGAAVALLRSGRSVARILVLVASLGSAALTSATQPSPRQGASAPS